jgi:hypothetical protein
MPGSPDTQTRLRVALLDADPIRVLGFAAAFERHQRLEFIPLDLPGLIADLKLSLCVIGLHGNLNLPVTLSTLRGLRPDMLILLMGPEISDEEKLSLVSSGAKAYLMKPRRRRPSNWRSIRSAMERFGRRAGC